MDASGLSVRKVGTNGVPLQSVEIYDGSKLFRRFMIKQNGSSESYLGNFHQVLMLETFLHSNLVLVARDKEGGTAVSLPRRHWKAGIHSVEFCSDHVNDCSAVDVLLAHGPYAPPSAIVGVLPASVAGYTWVRRQFHRVNRVCLTVLK